MKRFSTHRVMLASTFLLLLAGAATAQTDTNKPDTGSTNIYDFIPPHTTSPVNPAQVRATDQYNTFTKIGNALLAVGDYAGAEANYRQATEAVSTFSEGWIHLAQALDYEGDTQEAFVAYRKAFVPPPNITFTSFVPRDVEGLARYGLLCEQSGQHEAAVQSYNKAREWGDSVYLKPLDKSLDVKVTSPLLATAMLNMLRGFSIENDDYQNGSHRRSQEALTVFQDAARALPNDPRTRFYLAYGLRKDGQFKQAYLEFQNAAQLDKDGFIKSEAEKNIRAVQANQR